MARSSLGLAISLGLAVLILSLLLSLARLHWLGNRHVVIPGEVHRSAQPSPRQLEAWIDEFGLRSVIHLKRGLDPERLEDLDEERLVVSRSAAFIRVDMTAQRLPSPGELGALIDAITSAPRPMLVHCESGVDRSGLASAIVLLLDGTTPALAARQFSVRFGYPGRRFGSPLPQVLDAYFDWLDAQALVHQPKHFRSWAGEHYIASYYLAEVELLSPTRVLPVDREVDFQVRVTNRSPLAIPIGCGKQAVRVSVSLRASGTPEPEFPDTELEWRNCLVSGDLAPGAVGLVEVPGVRVPAPGSFDIVVDLVDEKEEHYFETMGSSALRTHLTTQTGPVPVATLER